MTRRTLLAAALVSPALLKARSHDNFPTEPRARLAVSTYPFRNLIGPGNMTLQEFAKTIPQKFNVHGIEPWSHHFESTSPEYVRKLSDSFESSGLTVVNIPADIEVHLCGSEEDRRAGLALYRNWVDAAVLLKSPSIRLHLPHAKKGDEIQCAVAAIKILVDYGRSKNIVINIENDEPQTEQPERIVEVIKTIGSPFLHALPDFCNSMLVKDSESYNESAMRMLFPLAFNISHVKDRESDAGKMYRVNVDRIFEIAKSAQYRGYFSMEWDSTGDPYEGTRTLLEASLRNLS
jgi:sugar phosphate isomerase/epimerase